MHAVPLEGVTIQLIQLTGVTHVHCVMVHNQLRHKFVFIDFGLDRQNVLESMTEKTKLNEGGRASGKGFQDIVLKVNVM